MKVAVVGAGVAGLAVTWHLLEKGHDVVVFDKGGSASAVSTGLLHTSPGREAKLSWKAEEGIRETKKLLEIAGPGVYIENGIVRFAVNEGQRERFQGNSQDWVAGAAEEKVKWIPEGITVFSRKYLEGLKRACSKAEFVEAKVGLEDLREFDRIVIAGGGDTIDFPGCHELGLRRNFGQMLICRWKEPIEVSLLGLGHITPMENPELCQVGSTYEHGVRPEKEKALQLLEKVAVFYPPAKDFEVVEIRSGVRIAPKMGYMPIVAQVGEKAWVFSGFGSRGLLYHAMMSKSLVDNPLFIY